MAVLRQTYGAVWPCYAMAVQMSEGHRSRKNKCPRLYVRLQHSGTREEVSKASTGRDARDLVDESSARVAALGLQAGRPKNT